MQCGIKVSHQRQKTIGPPDLQSQGWGVSYYLIFRRECKKYGKTLLTSSPKCLKIQWIKSHFENSTPPVRAQTQRKARGLRPSAIPALKALLSSITLEQAAMETKEKLKPTSPAGTGRSPGRDWLQFPHFLGISQACTSAIFAQGSETNQKLAGFFFFFGRIMLSYTLFLIFFPTQGDPQLKFYMLWNHQPELRSRQGTQ